MEVGSYEILWSTICQVVLNCNHFIQLLALCRQGEIHDFFNTKCHICGIMAEKYIFSFLIISAAAVLGSVHHLMKAVVEFHFVK